MNLYNLHITKEELELLLRNYHVVLDDTLETDCDNCSVNIGFEIQLFYDEGDVK